MRQVKVITHHHPKFLKEAYKMDVQLHNNVDEIETGHRYISFDADRELFCVYKKSESPRLVGKFDSIISAMYYAKRV
jgi:hypothetical protein